MSHSQDWPRSNNPNAPKIPRDLYFREKARFAGLLIVPVLYGIVIVLFFRCMAALLNPVHRRREGIKWGLVSHTVVTFFVVTVLTGMQLDILSVCFIDNRKFPGVEGVLPPGPLGYQWLIYSRALGIGANLMFFLNNWLADALLLYRCFIIYSMNPWIVAFPCVMYLGSLAMGVMLLYQSSQPRSSIWNAVVVSFSLPYFSLSIALNTLLTLMIVIRLILHSRNIQAVMGVPVGTGGLYKAIITMLIESSALYAVNSLLFIVPWATGNRSSDFFLSTLAEIQVIAPLLIIQRVANKSALTNNTAISGHISESSARSRERPMGGSGTPVSRTS